MTDISWLEARLQGAGKPVVIDGGMGTHLEQSGVPMDGKVWNARANLTHPDAVRKAHQDFISAGAEVIITNTFSAGRHMLEPAGLGDEVKSINQNAVRLAREACDQAADQAVAIAGSICEWTSSNDPAWHTRDAIERAVSEQAELLAASGVDLIALEMCAHPQFSVAAVEAILQTGLPTWIGVSAQSHKGRDSLSVFDYMDVEFEGLVATLAEYPAMMMNVMHTPIPDVGPALEIVKRYWGGPTGVYPESGFFEMPNWQFIDVVDPEELAKYARPWLAAGVRGLGGCCGLGPAHIAALRNEIDTETD